MLENGAMEPNRPPAAPEAPLEPEEYYMDGPNLVFTEAHHLKRGFCCSSGCRHCPFGYRGPAAALFGSLPLPDDEPAEG
jgi:hypothetical protein